MTAAPIAAPDEPRRLVLVGNPNVGKSVLFGAFTGKYVTVANYPGTTVEITRGSARIGDEELSACEMEHMLSEEVVDRVCTFLGHPPKCPHGNPVPQGACCRKLDRKVEPLIGRLCDLPIGGRGTIAFITPKSPARLNRLATLGIVPGTMVKLVQRKPSFVIRCGETTVAIEEEIANEILVRPEDKVSDGQVGTWIRGKPGAQNCAQSQLM